MAIARASRTVAVGTTPVNIRGTNLLPVSYARMQYPSGGGVIELVPLSTSAYGDGEPIAADTNFRDDSQSIARYAVASTGSVNLRITDFEN